MGRATHMAPIDNEIFIEKLLDIAVIKYLAAG